MSRSAANLLLLLAGAIWGMGFIAQQTAMDDMGPMLFIGLRFLLAGFAILPFAIRELKASKKSLREQRFGRFVLLGTVFFLGMALQQVGLMATTVTNAGFLTTLYVIMVPFIMLLVLRQRPANFVWPATAFSLLGIYLLSFRDLTTIAWGDLLVLLCALVWAIHVILVGILARQSALPVTMTCVQFFTSSALGFSAQAILVAAGAVDGEWDASILVGALPEILFTGIFSGGLAFTLQAIGQRYTTPSVAAILMASESLFAAIFGAVLLGERLDRLGYLGCVAILSAIVMVEVLHSRQSKIES